MRLVRIVVVASFLGVAAAAVSTLPAAAGPPDPPGCTFQTGLTTCVTTQQSPGSTVSVDMSSFEPISYSPPGTDVTGQQICESVDPQGTWTSFRAVNWGVSVSTVTTTTTVRHGASPHGRLVSSTSNTQTEVSSGPIMATSTLKCATT